MDAEQALQAAAQSRMQGPADSGDVELSADEWQAWEVFRACETNWRVLIGIGLVHYEGIEYASLAAVMDMLAVPKKRRRDVFWMVRVLEGEAARWINRRDGD